MLHLPASCNSVSRTLGGALRPLFAHGREPVVLSLCTDEPRRFAVQRWADDLTEPDLSPQQHPFFTAHEAKETDVASFVKVILGD